MVLLAMGFVGPERYIINELELDQDPRSNIETVPGKYATSVPRVYAAGGRSPLDAFLSATILIF